jgi:hypothetical protein
MSDSQTSPMSAMPTQVIQHIGRFLGVQDLANFSMINKTTHDAQRDLLLRLGRMIDPNQDPNLSNMAGSLLKNTKAEKRAIHALIDGGLVKVNEIVTWEEATEQQQAAVRPKFKTPGLKPDAIVFGTRPLDFFVSNLPDPTKIPGNKADAILLGKANEAITSGIPNGTSFKWQKYGGGAIAVANISDFPASLSTAQVVIALRNNVAAPQDGHSLWLVRGYEVAVVYP